MPSPLQLTRPLTTMCSRAPNPWCGPCKQIAPILEEIYAEHGGKLEIRKLDSDANPGSTMRFGVTGLPTLALFVNGELVKSIVGAKPKRVLLKELDAWLR